MELKGLVPPLELCQKIPVGRFEDCAFIWDKSDGVGFWDGVDKDGNHIGGFGKIPAMNWRVRNNFSERTRKHLKENGVEINYYPAPTLQEILQDLANGNNTVTMTYFCYDDEFVVTGQRGAFKGTGVVKGHRGNIAEAALRAWLEEMGIDV